MALSRSAPRATRFLKLAAAPPRRAAPGATARRPAQRGGVLKHDRPRAADLRHPRHRVSYQTQLVSSFVRRTLFKFVNGAQYGPSDFTLVPDLALKAGGVGGRAGLHDRAPPRRPLGVAGARQRARAGRRRREVLARARAQEVALRAASSARSSGSRRPTSARCASTSRTPSRPFLHNLAEPWTAILPPEVEDRLGDFKAAESLIGCGPFVLERYEPGVKAVFARNPTYHASGLPYLDKVEWLFVKDRATQLSLFRAGQVDLPSHDARIPRAEASLLQAVEPRLPGRILGRAGGPLPRHAHRHGRPSTTCGCAARFSLAVDRKTWVAEHLDGDGAEDSRAGAERDAQWKLAAPQLGEGARYLQHDPALARTLLAEAGFPAGLKVKCTSWPGYGPEYVEDLERLAAHLRRAGVELQIVHEEYGQYIRGSFLGRFEEASWGPSSLFTEVDGYLYSFFRSGQAGNRSHVADTQLDVLLEAQRRFTSPSSRKKIIDEIQRRAAAQVYYVYTPYPPTRVVVGAAGEELRAEELLRPGRSARGGLARPGLRAHPGPFSRLTVPVGRLSQLVDPLDMCRNITPVATGRIQIFQVLVSRKPRSINALGLAFVLLSPSPDTWRTRQCMC